VARAQGELSLEREKARERAKLMKAAEQRGLAQAKQIAEVRQGRIAVRRVSASASASDVRLSASEIVSVRDCGGCQRQRPSAPHRCGKRCGRG
jgi:hypothetical protein